MSTLPVRIMVQEAWDQVELALPPGASVQEAKQRALALTHTAGEAADFLVKFRGAPVLDERRSLADIGVVARSSLIVLPRRRQPVR